MKIELPFPHKVLWPNGRTKSKAWKNKLFQQHKNWAYLATIESKQGGYKVIPCDKQLAIKLIVHPKPRGPAPDEDNSVSALKAYQDGIADALGIDDRNFRAPVVEIGERRPHGAFVVTI